MNKEKLLDIVGDARVVAMCGISGSGKTTLARMLESEGFVRLSVDRLAWDRCGAGLSQLAPDCQMEVFREASVEILRLTERLIAAGSRVVVDSTMCKRFKRDSLRALCRAHGCEPLFIFLDADLPLLIERLSRRRGTGPDDQPVAVERLRGFFAGFERPAPDESVITIK